MTKVASPIAISAPARPAGPAAVASVCSSGARHAAGTSSSPSAFSTIPPRIPMTVVLAARFSGDETRRSASCSVASRARSRRYANVVVITRTRATAKRPT